MKVNSSLLGEDFSSIFSPKGFKGPRGQGVYTHAEAAEGDPLVKGGSLVSCPLPLE
jgi:hypothetical protein